jgi:hypothetical protein
MSHTVAILFRVIIFVRLCLLTVCLSLFLIFFFFYLQINVSSNPKGAELEGCVIALNIMEELAKNCMVLSAAYLCNSLPAILAASGNKQLRVRTASESAVTAITTKISPNAVMEILPHLFKATEVGVAWQTRALALRSIASFSEHAPEQLGFSLPEVNSQTI